MGLELSIFPVLNYKDMKDSSHLESLTPLHRVWRSGMRLGSFKSSLGTPRTGSTVPGSAAWESVRCKDLRLLSPWCPAPRAHCFLELPALVGLGKMSRIYHDSVLRNKAVQSARLPGSWDPAAHQG